VNRSVRALVGFAAGVAASGACLAQPLPSGAGECVARIEQQRYAESEDADEPLELGDVCPELVDEINAGVWGESLADVWADELSATAFVTLTELVARYERPPAPLEALSAAALDDVLAELSTRAPPVELSLWDRAKQQLQEWFGQRSRRSSGWLEDWFADLSVPERWLRYFVIALGIALAAATVLIVWNELREAGVLGRTRGRIAAVADGAAASEPRRRARTLEEVGLAPLARQPVLLLALVLDRLRRRMPVADSATHRELAAAAGSLTDAERGALSAVTGAAERVTFGGWQPERGDVDALLTTGATLLDSLSADDGGSS
jgi:hypothetical protein